MNELINNLYEQFLAGQNNLICWLIGHTPSMDQGESCKRCGMNLCFFMANRDDLTSGGLFLGWRFQAMIGRLASIITKDGDRQQLARRTGCHQCMDQKFCRARISK
jgi:hypothetical protein